MTGRTFSVRRRALGAAALGPGFRGDGMTIAAARSSDRSSTANGVTFRLWAPAAKRVDLMLERRACRCGAARTAGSTCACAGTGAGTRYKFRIDGELDVPDPASALPAATTSSARARSSITRYRLAAPRLARPAVARRPSSSNCMSAPSRRKAPIARRSSRLDHLVDAGITAIELMPLADFAGRRNWGYDGVLLYAPDSAYGRPDDLKALIDAAHLRGLMVFLDVVYNHFGPEGNYLGRYAPQFFTDAHTPWGTAIDYRVPQVRAFAIENALHWLRDYRFDGLRLDAVHAIVEPGGPRCCRISAAPSASFAAATGRHIHLVLENDDNRAQPARSATDPPRRQVSRAVERRLPPRLARAADRRDAGLLPRLRRDAAPAHRARARLRLRLSGRGLAASRRRGARRSRAAHLPPTAFVNFLQNHDQIGNRAARRAACDSWPDAAGDRGRARHHAARARCRRCCSWARNGARPAVPVLLRFRRRSRRGGAQGPPRGIQAGPMPSIGDEIPDPLAEADLPLRRARLGRASNAPQGRRRLALVRELLAVAPRGDRSASRRRGIRSSARVAGTVLTAQLAARRRPALVAARQSVRPSQRAGRRSAARARRSGASDAGRRAAAWSVYLGVGAG